MNPVVACDLDGVLCDFEGKFCEVFGYAHREKVSLEGRYPFKSHEIHQFVNNPDTYRDLKPIEFGLRIIEELDSLGLDIVFVTSRPHGTNQVTSRWLEKELLPSRQVYRVDGSKRDAFKEIQPIFVIDDMLSVADTARELGIPAIIVEQPWNKDGVGYWIADTIKSFLSMAEQYGLLGVR